MLRITELIERELRVSKTRLNALTLFSQIGTNGIIGLGDRYNSFLIEDMDSSGLSERKIICPYWTDLMTFGSDSAVYYNVYKRFVICLYFSLRHQDYYKCAFRGNGTTLRLKFIIAYQ